MEGWDVSLTFGTPSFTDYNNMSEEQSLKQKTAKGLFWGGLSSSIQQLLGLLFGIVLGRLLDRSDYGMIGMLAIFPAIASARRSAIKTTMLYSGSVSPVAPPCTSCSIFQLL